MTSLEKNYTKWVACWGNATSITDRKESTYSKDITLRYSMRICFSGRQLRFRFSNLTGTESVSLTKACAARVSDAGDIQAAAAAKGATAAAVAACEAKEAADSGATAAKGAACCEAAGGSAAACEAKEAADSGATAAKGAACCEAAGGSAAACGAKEAADSGATAAKGAAACSGAGCRKWEPVAITFGGERSVSIAPGTEVESDPLPMDITAGDRIDVSMYFADFTQMNAGTLVTGPLSYGTFGYGDYTEQREMPADLSRKTNWFYFLNTIDILTEEKNHALVCYGDSITAQSWPDYLSQRCWEDGYHDVSIIRRAVCGTRVLRQYSCIAYQAYGLKGETRFPIELNVAGAEAVIIQHGINDIIHPVGTDVNPFRPWSDLPTVDDLKDGVRRFYIAHARKLGLKVYSGTLLPIYGWRTYNANRDTLRAAFNDWLRQSEEFDGCVDFDRAVRDEASPLHFAPGFDSGDHLHPSEAAYKAMAYCVPEELF